MKFDAIIIGTGQAGPSLAARLSAAGMAVAIIERHKFGGTCVNIHPTVAEYLPTVLSKIEPSAKEVQSAAKLAA